MTKGKGNHLNKGKPFKIREVVSPEGNLIGLVKGNSIRSINNKVEKYALLSQKKCLLHPSWKKLPWCKQEWANLGTN